MRKFFIITSSIITGLLVGIIGTTIYLNNQSSKVSNFTIRTTNFTGFRRPEIQIIIYTCSSQIDHA